MSVPCSCRSTCKEHATTPGSDHKGVALILYSLPHAKNLFGDKGYSSNTFRQALVERGITPCVPSRKSRKVPIHYARILDRQCHHIENMFGHLKN